jgi:hypothetical protein
MVEFESFDKILTVIVGIDGTPPPREIQLDMRESLNIKVNDTAGYSQTRDSVTLTVDENPTRDERGFIGEHTQYLAKFDIELKDTELNQDIVNAAHNTVVDLMKDLGFNVTGTATRWDNRLQL